MSLNKRFILVLLAASGLLRAAGIANAQDSKVPGLPKAILSAKPAELLSCLPATPPRWTLLRSDGTTNFTTWITTRVQRDIKQNLPPPTPGTLPPVPGTITIRINDAGYTADYTPDFSPPKSGNPPTGVTYTKLGSFPARKQKVDETTTFFYVLVKQRFMIEVHAKNVLDQDLQNYVSMVDYRGLLAIPDIGPDKVPQPAIMTKVDELDPTKNNTYSIYWSRPEPQGTRKD